MIDAVGFLVEYWSEIVLAVVIGGLIARWFYENVWLKDPDDLVALVTEVMLALYAELREQALELSVEEIEEIVRPWYDRLIAGTPFERVVTPRDLAEFIYERLHMLDEGRLLEIHANVR